MRGQGLVNGNLSVLPAVLRDGMEGIRVEMGGLKLIFYLLKKLDPPQTFLYFLDPLLDI